MDLPLSADVLEGLQLVADSTHIPDSSFTDFVVGVCESLYDDSKRDAVIENTALSSVDVAVLKEAYSSVATFLLEAVKADQNVDSLSHLLEDAKFSPDRIALFNKIYTEQKPHLQILLSSVGRTHPHIVDVDWRLDYCLKNNQVDRVNEPTFLISLKTQHFNHHRWPSLGTVSSLLADCPKRDWSHAKCSFGFTRRTCENLRNILVHPKAEWAVGVRTSAAGLYPGTTAGSGHEVARCMQKFRENK